MGVVVRRTGGEIDDFDAKFRAEIDELNRFGELGLDRIVLIHAERVAIRKAVRKILGNTRPRFSGERQERIRLERNEIEGAEAHSQFDSISSGADAGDDFAKDAGAVFEGAAVFAGTGEGTQEFVKEISVAMFDVDEVSADVPRDFRGTDIVLDKLLDLGIGPDLIVAGDLEFLVKNGVTIGYARLHSEFIVWLAEAAGMRELKSDDEILGVCKSFTMGAYEGFAQFCQAGFVRFGDDELVGIGAAVRADGHGFAAID